MNRKQLKPEEMRKLFEETERRRRERNTKPGSISNAIIRRRNGGVRHQFEDDIGGCSANYK